MDKNLSLTITTKKPWIGRPPKFQDPIEFQRHIDEYFAIQDAKGHPYTVTGLALHFDSSREALLRYEDEVIQKLTDCDKAAFRDAIKRAKNRVHEYAEKSCFRSVGQVAGTIFALKNNFGWQDRVEIEISGHISASQVSEKEKEELRFSLSDFYRDRREKVRVDR